MKDYQDHSSRVTIPTAAQNLWNNLSDFWQNHDHTLISSVWAAWQKIIDAIATTFESKNNDSTIFADVYSYAYNHVPVEISLDTSSPNGYVIQGYNFRHILQLQDFINNPDVTLTEGIDFTYTTPLKIGQPGYIDTTSDINGPVWIFYIQEKTLEELIARFGIFVDYSYIRSEESKTIKDILTLMKAQEFGSIIQHMECALCVENNFPYTLYGGTVLAITGTTSLVIAIDDNNIEVIENTTGLPFRQRLEDGTWDTLSVGDFIVGPSQVIEAVTITDKVLNPDYYKKVPVGELESYHTFVVKFNANLPDPFVAYQIDLDASLRRVLKLKKITSKPYITIMFDFALDTSTGATSYVNLDSLGALIGGTSWTNLLLKMNVNVSATSYGFDLDPLSCGLTTSYSDYILSLELYSLYTSFTSLLPLPGSIGGTSYGGI